MMAPLSKQNDCPAHNGVRGNAPEGQDERVDDRIKQLKKEIALLADKLANAEDELAVQYRKCLMNETREQERVARHHKAMSQLQKKVLAEAEIKRKLQRKIDEKEAPIAAAHSEKEAMWTIEREKLSAQVKTLEEEKRILLEEIARSSAQLQRFETGLLEMNFNMQELEKKAAHWKLTVEKQDIQVSVAIAAQRSSDSRVVVLEAELKRRREQDKFLLAHAYHEKGLQVNFPTPSADIQTQTEAGTPLKPQEIRRRDLEQWAYLMHYVIQTCSEAALAVENATCLAVLDELHSIPPATLSADAAVGTEPPQVCHVAVETDAGTPPLTQSVDAENAAAPTLEQAMRVPQTCTQTAVASSDIPSHTAAVPRIQVAHTHAHVAVQTDAAEHAFGSRTMQSDAEMVSHHSTSPPSLSAAAAGAEQRDERKRGEASSSSFSSSSAGGGGGEHRDERWWRRSPLKAIGAMLTPCTLTLDDSPMQPSVPQLLAADAAHALAHTPKATSLPASFESVYTREREPEREASSLLVGFACPVSPMPTSTGTPRPPPQVTEP
jgi:hypothetical protein